MSKFEKLYKQICYTWTLRGLNNLLLRNWKFTTMNAPILRQALRSDFYLRHRNLSIRKIFQEASSFRKALSMDERVSEICNSQSIGAAIENMTLEAAAQGLGSLWICNSFFAQKELSDWAGGELYAVLAVGYADEAPEARLRKRTEDVIEWRV